MRDDDPIKKRLLLFVAPLAFALVLAACGGRNERTYSFDGTWRCHSKIGNVAPDSIKDDYFALDASGGAIRAQVRTNEVILSFGADYAEARRVENDYKGGRATLGGAVERQGNAVLVWTDPPTKDEHARVRSCLTE